jgi:hypothetical protein
LLERRIGVRNPSSIEQEAILMYSLFWLVQNLLQRLGPDDESPAAAWERQQRRIKEAILQAQQANRHDGLRPAAMPFARQHRLKRRRY